MAFTYYTPFTVAASQVPSTQSNFPVCFCGQDNRFRTVANGGHVQNSSGFDLRPYSDSGLTSALTYELVMYNATTGLFEIHVKQPSLSNGSVIYMAYGDSGISTDGSSSATWSNSFVSVYHFKDGTTLSLTDSAGSSNGTGTGTPTAAVGQIDGGMGLLSATPQFVSTTSNATPAAITLSAWVKATSFPGAYNSVIIRNNTNTNYAGILVKSTGKLACLIGTSSTDRSYDGTGSHTLSTATWYYLTLTYDTTLGLIGYVNAASDGTHAGGASLSFTAGNDIGRDSVNSGRNWNGTVDEIRESSVARSADWIATEYNNQLNPTGTGFWVIGTEVSLAGANSGFLRFM